MGNEQENVNASLPQPVQKGEANITVNKITFRSVDRTPKTVGTWRNSHKAAESVYYPNRSQLYDLYDDILLDAHLSGIINKRINTALNKILHFIGVNGEKDDDFDTLIASTMFRKCMKQPILKKMWGIRGMEAVPGPELDMRQIPNKHIKPKWGIISYEQNGTEGVSYIGKQNLWVIGEPDDLGLLLICGYYALLKRGTISDWAQYIEIFGQPLRVVKYDGYDTQTDTDLDRALENAGSSMYLKIPKEANLEVMDGKTSNGDGKLQDAFRQAMNEEMSVIILGNTETTTSSKSSGYAQSKEHGKQQMEITKTDLVDILSELNSPQFLAILKSYGYNTDGGKFEFAKEIDAVTVGLQMDNAIKAKELGVPLDDGDIYDMTGFKKPKDYDEQKKKAEELTPVKVKLPKDDKADPESGEGLPKNLWYKIRETVADFFAPAHS